MITRLGGRKVSPIGIGTYGMGGYLLSNTKNDRNDIKALKFALDNGINVIDTAEMYGHGHSEEIVREAIKGRDREDIFIMTKVLPTHLGRKSMRKSLQGSLSRLGCKYIDLYQIHWLLPGSNIAKVVSSMEELVDEGLVRNIGVSNFNAEQTKIAVEAAKRHKVLSNQIKYNLYRKRCEEKLLPFCEKNGVSIIAYTPLSKGTLGSGRIEAIGAVRDISERTGKTPVQIALNYLMRRSLPIPKSSNTEHIREILGAKGWRLSSRDYNLLGNL